MGSTVDFLHIPQVVFALSLRAPCSVKRIVNLCCARNCADSKVFKNPLNRPLLASMPSSDPPPPAPMRTVAGRQGPPIDPTYPKRGEKDRDKERGESEKEEEEK